MAHYTESLTSYQFTSLLREFPRSATLLCKPSSGTNNSATSSSFFPTLLLSLNRCTYQSCWYIIPIVFLVYYRLNNSNMLKKYYVNLTNVHVNYSVLQQVITWLFYCCWLSVDPVDLSVIV